MDINFLAVAVAALVPLIIGFVWYSNSLFGKTWMVVAEMTEAKMKSGNMAVVFGLTYLFSFFLAFSLNFIVIHQFAVNSIFQGDPGFGDPNSEVGRYLADFMAQHGDKFRSFKHGAFHGVLSGLFLAMPLLGINALFERKGFKYIAIHTGYWIVTFALMGGILCGWK